jgi:hypothetical protein
MSFFGHGLTRINGLDFIFRRVTPAENQGHREVVAVLVSSLAHKHVFKYPQPIDAADLSACAFCIGDT